MKEKILTFIIGLLLGAVISTGSIYFYTLAAKTDNSSNTQNSMQMPSGDQSGNTQNAGGTPPDMPGSSSETTTQANN